MFIITKILDAISVYGGAFVVSKNKQDAHFLNKHFCKIFQKIYKIQTNVSQEDSDMLKQGQVQKQTARLSMKLWLPILESSLSELSKSVDEMMKPLVSFDVNHNNRLEFMAKLIF